MRLSLPEKVEKTGKKRRNKERDNNDSAGVND